MAHTRNWVCPHCNRPQTLTESQHRTEDTYLNLNENKPKIAGLFADATTCANPDCREVTLTVHLTSGSGHFNEYTSRTIIETFQLRPQGAAKPQPEFIPEAIRSDYLEACRIRDLSPKASATLARRCLQGMIRDFCGISKNRLVDEIRDLRQQLDDHVAARGVTHESIDAIDAVRSVGNIGAHMEKDVSLIVDIEPGEAQMLIDLIEMLFDEWYIERQKREKRLAEITALSTQKAKELADAKAAALNSAAPAADETPT